MIVNAEQKLQVSVYDKHEMIATQNFKLKIMDMDAPVIEYEGPTTFETYQDIDIEDHLFVYDDRNHGELRYLLEAQNEQNDLKFEYVYTCGTEKQRCPLQFYEEGTYDIHVSAWDGHGNNSQATFTITIISPNAVS